MKVGLENSIVDAGLAIAVLYSIYRRTILVLSGGPMNLWPPWGHREKGTNIATLLCIFLQQLHTEVDLRLELPF